MEWVVENAPLASGAAVTLLSFFSSCIKLLNESSAAAKSRKALIDYSEILSRLPEGSASRIKVEELLQRETEFLLNRVSRKLNVANIIAAILIAMVGGAISYVLALWAINSDVIGVAILAWVLFSGVALFTFALSITGLASRYKPTKQNSKVGSDCQ